jgi:hypothetical protein
MATIGGGGGQSVVSGEWYTNAVWSSYATVSGGLGNQAGSTNSDPSVARGAAVGGGGLNLATGQYSTISGGYGNQATNEESTVPGGYGNVAGGVGSFAAGTSAQALYRGSFVWADDYYSGLLSFSDTGPNQFDILAHGGVQVYGGGLAVTGASSPHYPGTSGVYLEGSTNAGYVYAWNYNSYLPLPLQLNSPGGNVGIGPAVPTHLFQVGNAYCDGNTWAPISDRSVKAGFQPVDVQEVLARVVAMPITRWHYTNDEAIPHIGPMAQDFYAAFNVGADDRHITTTDESGVALTAIQGLNQRLEQKDAEIAELKQNLADIQRVVQRLAVKK